MRGLVIRLAIAAAAMLLGVLGFIAALAWFLFAIDLKLDTMMTPALAALATGGAAILFALIVMLIGRSVLSGRRSKPSRKHDSGDPALELGRVIGEEAANFVTEHKRGVLIASLAAGFAFGISPRLRKLLLRLF